MLVPDALLLNHLPALIGWKDINRRYIGANKALVEAKGFTAPDEMIGKTDDELSPWSVDDNKIYLHQDVDVLRGATVSTVHSDLKTSDVYVLEKRPLIDEHNNVMGLIYHCYPSRHDYRFNMLRRLDSKLHLGTSHYSLNDHHNKFELTPREHECLFLLIRGKSAKEIGVLLSLSKRTVESYIENLKNKMGCNNKAEILVKAVLNGYHEKIPKRLNDTAIIEAL